MWADAQSAQSQPSLRLSWPLLRDREGHQPCPLLQSWTSRRRSRARRRKGDTADGTGVAQGEIFCDARGGARRARHPLWRQVLDGLRAPDKRSAKSFTHMQKADRSRSLQGASTWVRTTNHSQEVGIPRDRLLRLLVAHRFPPKDPGDPLADDSEGQITKRAPSTATESGTWNRWTLTVGALLSFVLAATAVTRIQRNRRANTDFHRLSREIASGP